MAAETMKRHRSERLEVRTTVHERDLIDKAVAASGVGLTEFVVSNLTVVARRVLADRVEFQLAAAARERWEMINLAPARSLAGLAALFDRTSPFVDE
jgi:uncharacterized protein (DUF1778 family)